MSLLNKIFRCDFPITTALDVVGDKWTLVIIKQMLLECKKTFKEFYESEKTIATNILSSRLKNLENIGFISKVKPADNKKTNLYLLTTKGLSLTPVIIELALWTNYNVKPMKDHELKLWTEIEDKNKLQELIIKRYKEKTYLIKKK